MFDWDDLRIFVAAARSGSLGAASQHLGIDTATVGRRIARLETALKSTLVVRSKTGLQLTAIGGQLLQIGLDAEATMAAAANVVERDTVGGTVRVSAAEGFGTVVLAPALPALAAARPGLRIELAANAGFLSPTRREVDMAITLSAPASPRLVVEPLTHYQLALYAAPSYLVKHGAPATVTDLRKAQIVGYVDDLIYAAELRYLDEILPGLTPVLASSSIRAQREIVLGGGGIGVLPCFLAEGLTRVLGDQVLLQRRFWLSTHHDVHDTARMRAVRSWLGQLVQGHHTLLEPF
jgi:DNA-binding transcriptional LysR family regulator